MPQYFIEQVLSVTENYNYILLLIIGILIIAGCVMEAVPNIVLIAPVLYPLSQQIGMDQVHFCILMVTSLGIGFITPPIGLNLFVISGVTGESILDVAKYVFPYVFAMLCVAILVAFVPEVSLVLPGALGADGACSAFPSWTDRRVNPSLGRCLFSFVLMADTMSTARTDLPRLPSRSTRWRMQEPGTAWRTSGDSGRRWGGWRRGSRCIWAT